MNLHLSFSGLDLWLGALCILAAYTLGDWTLPIIVRAYRRVRWEIVSRLPEKDPEACKQTEKFLERWRALEPDSRRALLFIARRLEGGQIQYGPLSIAESGKDWGREAAEELADATFYQAVQLIERFGDDDTEEPLEEAAPVVLDPRFADPSFREAFNNYRPRASSKGGKHALETIDGVDGGTYIPPAPHLEPILPAAPVVILDASQCALSAEDWEDILSGRLYDRSARVIHVPGFYVCERGHSSPSRVFPGFCSECQSEEEALAFFKALEEDEGEWILFLPNRAPFEGILRNWTPPESEDLGTVDCDIHGEVPAISCDGFLCSRCQDEETARRVRSAARGRTPAIRALEDIAAALMWISVMLEADFTEEFPGEDSWNRMLPPAEHRFEFFKAGARYGKDHYSNRFDGEGTREAERACANEIARAFEACAKARLERMQREERERSDHNCAEHSAERAITEAGFGPWYCVGCGGLWPGLSAVFFTFTFEEEPLEEEAPIDPDRTPLIGRPIKFCPACSGMYAGDSHACGIDEG